MGSLSFFDPTRVVLEFLAIQADRMGRKRLEIEFRRSPESEDAQGKICVYGLKVDTASKKAFYATEEGGELREFSSAMLKNIGGVRIV